MGRPSPAQPQRSTRLRTRLRRGGQSTRSTTVLFSYDEAEPFHFSIKPNAVNDQCECGDERKPGADQKSRRAFNKIDPNTPGAGAKREQRREDDENYVKTSQGHLVANNRIIPGEINEPEKSEDKETGENENAIDQFFFGG